ncbi:MAG: bifunctional adenosylcobinamide kinase/adenosylcobinamide-phosphate guanylyltransferase [Lachnospiraceae bacterium]|nr:bifunctional adenosylcobinamide kinase/adenosylcobinamide-phosphate guanylyltransferase [Lachnospiraceae bacterium]
MLHIITGGSGSGKSAYAEEQILKLEPAKRFYIATMHPFDSESEKRIKRHRMMRSGKGFETIECYTNISSLTGLDGANVLLECMSNLVANEMYEKDGAGLNTVTAVIDGIRRINDQAENLIVVTNEIFSDIQQYEEETLRYMRYLGDINVRMQKEADCVTEIVYGIPVVVKSAQPKEKI